jgi:MFS family permease
MKQALHIFQKDVRYLRYDIAVSLLAVLAFAVAGYNIPALGAFLPVAWWFLIARAIHAEPLPGHRQFWVTRPYRWQGLLGAKVLFILAFVNLPLFLADLVIVRAAGASVGHELAGLVWTQVLLTAAFILPATAFSVITGGITDLLLVTLLMVLGVLMFLLAGAWFHWSPSNTPWFELEWVRTYAFIAQLAAAALLIVLWQYARRNTAATRIAACVAAGVLVVSSILLPWRAAFALQTLFSQNSISTASIHIELASDREWLGRIYSAQQDRTVAELPLKITGLPPATKLIPNGLIVKVRAPDGETSVGQLAPPESFSFESGILSLRAAMPTAFYTKIKDQPLQLEGKLFFTLYGNKRNTDVPLSGAPVLVSDVGVCSAGTHFVRCNSLLRAPSALVTLQLFQQSFRGPGRSMESPFPRRSYSPFPADLGVNPLSESFFSPVIDPISAANVTTLMPLAHLERSFALNHLHLTNFAATAPASAH